MVNVSRHGGTKNKYVREFNHLTTQLFNHLTRSVLRQKKRNSDVFVIQVTPSLYPALRSGNRKTYLIVISTTK